MYLCMYMYTYVYNVINVTVHVSRCIGIQCTCNQGI